MRIYIPAAHRAALMLFRRGSDAYHADRYAMRITFQKPGSPYHIIFCAGEER